MKQKGHKPEEMIRLLRECDGSASNQEPFYRQKRISLATLHRWRKQYGRMNEGDAGLLKALEKEKRAEEDGCRCDARDQGAQGDG